MQIPANDVELFLTMWLELLLFSNRKNGTYPDFQTGDDVGTLDPEGMIEVRNVLLAQPELIDQFVKQNPAGFSEEMLSVVSKWRHFVQGNFFIERYLAKHAIFVGESGIYKVKSLQESFDLIVPKESLPVYVEAVLLPFRGQIVYDGLMNIHQISFGAGYRADLRDIYSKSKRLGRLIETLDPASPGSAPVAAKRSQSFKNWQPEIDALFEQSQKLMAHQTAPGIQRESVRMVLSSIELAQIAADKSPDEDLIWERVNDINQSLRRIIKILEQDQ